jgi:hypothetical protein
MRTIPDYPNPLANGYFKTHLHFHIWTGLRYLLGDEFFVFDLKIDYEFINTIMDQ